MVLLHPKWLLGQVLMTQAAALIPNRLALSVSSPEKAGVGGSIPSLATMFPITYSLFSLRVGSKTGLYAINGAPTVPDPITNTLS